MSTPLSRLFLGLLAVALVALVGSTLLAACAAPALADVPAYVVPATAGLGSLPFVAGPLRLEPLFDPPNDKGAEQGLSRQDVEAIVRSKLGEGATDRAVQQVTEVTMRAAKAEAERDQYKQQAADLQKRLPDGAVVLTGDEARAYTTLKSREGAGETPLKAASDALTKAAADQQELSALRASKSLADAVAAEAAAGSPLNQLALETYVKGLKTEVADHVGPDGKTTKRAFAVVEKDGKESRQLLTEYLKADHAALMPALTAQTTTTTGTPATGVPTTQRGAFPSTVVPPASTGTPGGAFDLDAHIAKRNAARTSVPGKPAAPTAPTAPVAQAA